MMDRVLDPLAPLVLPPVPLVVVVVLGSVREREESVFVPVRSSPSEPSPSLPPPRVAVGAYLPPLLPTLGFLTLS